MKFFRVNPCLFMLTFGADFADLTQILHGIFLPFSKGELEGDCLV